MSAPVFDVTKFYQVRCTAMQVPSLFCTIRKIDAVMKQKSSEQTKRSLIYSLVLLCSFIATGLGPSGTTAAAIALSAVALVFIFVVGCSSWLFQKAKPTYPRGLAVFVLIMPGAFFYAAALAALDSGETYLNARTHLATCAIAVVVSVAVSAFVLRLTSGIRWKSAMPQEVELDYVERIVKPLLAEAPKDARCDILFNPFRGEWSRIDMPAPNRSGYTYESTADILLRMRLPLGDGRTLKLSIMEYAVSKTKNRKNKYKGTKHRVVFACDLPLMGDADAVALRASLAKEIGDEAVIVFVDKGKLSVVQVKKTTDSNRELEATHLVPVSSIMKTIAFMTRTTSASARQ